MVWQGWVYWSHNLSWLYIYKKCHYKSIQVRYAVTTCTSNGLGWGHVYRDFHSSEASFHSHLGYNTV